MAMQTVFAIIVAAVVAAPIGAAESTRCVPADLPNDVAERLQLEKETYCGLKRGGPWILRHLNATEDYYEESSSDQMRFQLWHNQNDRFFPPDRNMTTLFSRDSASFQYGLISMLAGGPYGQVGPGLHQLVQQDSQSFFIKWRDWAGRQLEYLKVKRDLFPCTGYDRVDGSAHIIKDRGFLFLFPTGLQPNAHTPANDEGIRAAVLAYPELIDPKAGKVHVVPAFAENLLTTEEFLALGPQDRAAALWAKVHFEVAQNK